MALLLSDHVLSTTFSRTFVYLSDFYFNLVQSHNDEADCLRVSLRLPVFFMFCVLGVYGDVHRVKILFNKKDTALIQMAEPHQAQLGNITLEF